MKVKVSVMRFEVVNGKKSGKSLAFELDVEKMAALGTREMVKKTVEKLIADSKVFKKEEVNDLKYDMKEFWDEWKKVVKKQKEEEAEKIVA